MYVCVCASVYLSSDFDSIRFDSLCVLQKQLAGRQHRFRKHESLGAQDKERNGFNNDTEREAKYAVVRTRERMPRRQQVGPRGDEEAPEEVPSTSLPLALVDAEDEASPTGEKGRKKKKREKYVDPWRTTGMGDIDADDLTLIDGHLALKEKPKKDDASSQIDAENKENELITPNDQPVIVMSPDRLGRFLFCVMSDMFPLSSFHLLFFAMQTIRDHWSGRGYYSTL